MLLDDRHDALVRGTWRKGGADCQKSVHPLALLGDGSVLVTAGVVLLHPNEKDEN